MAPEALLQRTDENEGTHISILIMMIALRIRPQGGDYPYSVFVMKKCNCVLYKKEEVKCGMCYCRIRIRQIWAMWIWIQDQITNNASTDSNLNNAVAELSAKRMQTASA